MREIEHGVSAPPTISVIIPVYNTEQYLHRCIDSVLAQTFPDFELLLIDDGSTDTSSAICDEYAEKDGRIRVFHKENGGLSSARNCGIDEASGVWVVFLDSDDLWADKDCLTKLHQYAVDNNLDVLRFEYQAVNENLEYIEPRSYDKSNIMGRIISNYELVKYGISGEWFAVLFLLRRDVLADLRFNEQTRFQEDIDFYCRLFAGQKFRCGYIDEKMYLYRKRTDSITTTYRVENLKGSFDLCDTFYDACSQTGDVKLSQLYVHYSVMMYYWTLQTLAAMPYYKHTLSIIDELKLELLHERVVKRLKEARVGFKYKIFIYPTPRIGVKILHFKDKLVLTIASLKYNRA